MVDVHVAPGVLTELFGFQVTNTMVAALCTSLVLLCVSLVVRRALVTGTPGLTQTALETVIGGVREYTHTLLGHERVTAVIAPFILSVFFIIFTGGALGLTPIFGSVGFEDGAHGFIELLRPVATDLNFTLSLACIAFLVIGGMGMYVMGVRDYIGKFIDVSSPVNFAVGLVELISEFARIISFSFRLFGNMFAGKVLLVMLVAFIPFLAPVPMLLYEFFVSLVQGFIFAILTLFFVKIAIQEKQ